MFERIRSLLGAPERRAGRLDDPLTLLLLGGAPTASGVAVSAETAMSCTPVFGAVKVLAETVAQLPMHLYRRLPDGGRERATEHPVYPLLADAANDWTPASEFRLVMTSGYVLHGNAFAYVGRTAGAVSELISLDPRSVSVDADPATMEPRYTVTSANGTRTSYSRRDIVHLRGIGTRQYQGDSPVAQAREAIALAIVLEQHGAGLFGRGARPAGILEYPRALTESLVERLRKSFEGLYGGGANAGRTAILEDGMTFRPLQLSSVDAQYLELRRFQLQEIARVFRVPLHLLGEMDRATFANVEAMGRQFLTFCLLPILKTWTDGLEITLLSAEERREFYIEFLVDDLARADLAARFTAYSQAINAGVLNPNEARAMENRPPYAGGETYMRPVNTAPAPTGNPAPATPEEDADGNA